MPSLCIAALVLLGLFFRAQAPSATQEIRVQHVIDGDTVELSDGSHLRYIGIDTPEVRRRSGERWIKDPEPYAQEATERNREWVEGKQVRLEFDVQSKDRYGRLLAYVYVAEAMVNAELIREGYALPMTIPPNVAHAELFKQLAKEAREAKRGLWKEKR